MHACALSKMSITETTAGCSCMTMGPLSSLNVKQFLASKLMCYSASPLLARFGTSRLPPPLKEKLFLKGQCFSNISDIQCDVTELLKVVSLQDFQHAFKDLYERSQHCMELGAIILQVCNKNFCISICFFHNGVSSLTEHTVYIQCKALHFRSSVVYMTFL